MKASPLSPRELAARIDHTLLSPTATEKDALRVCEEALRFGFRAVCLAPVFVPLARERLAGSGVRVCTVVGFPLGFQLTGTKVQEAEALVSLGAEELDLVANLGWIKAGAWERVAGELGEIRKAVPGTVLKVIIECGHLSREEKVRAVEVLAGAGVEFVKTSTGFGPSGATVEDVRLLAACAAGRLRVKAAGGIRTRAQALALLEAGADLLGTSAGAAIVAERQASPEGPVEVFVDGACLGNPGPGGYAVLLRRGGREQVITGGERRTTNNRMELLAAIRALEALEEPCTVDLYTDSRYLRDGITSWLPRWQRNGFRTSQGKPVKNRDLWERLAALARRHRVRWHWIPGHSGHPENERCDRLAREEARRQGEGA